MDEEKLKEGLAELKAESKMYQLKFEALLDVLASEGMVSRKDLEEAIEKIRKKE